EDIARSVRDHRECIWCRRQHWRGPSGACGARWLHRQYRPLANARSKRRELSTPIRCSQRLRTGVAARRYSAVDRCTKDIAGEGSQGTDRLVEGEPWEGNSRDSWRRWPGGHRYLLPEEHWYELPVRILSRWR